MAVRSLVKLTVGVGCVLGSLVLTSPSTGIVVGIVLATAVGNVAAGIAANALDALTAGNDRDRVSLENEHLTRAVGKAITAVITLAAKQYQGDIHHKLEKIAAQAKDNWVKIAQQELTQQSYPELREAKLDQFLTPEEYHLTQEGNLKDTEWGDIFIRLNMAACKGGGFSIPSEVREQVAELLHTTFPKALRETLKEDFAKDGKAFAGLTLQLLTGMKAEIKQLQTANVGAIQSDFTTILEHLQQLSTQLNGTKEQQEKVFREISQEINSGFAEVCEQLGVVEQNITELLNGLDKSISEIGLDVKEIKEVVQNLENRYDLLLFLFGDSFKTTSQPLSYSDLSWFSSLAENSNVQQSIKKAYQESLPDDASVWVGKGNNIGKMLQNIGRFNRIFEFFTRLSQDKNLPEEIRHQLNIFVETLDTKNSPVQNNYSGEEPFESHLMITVSCHNYNSKEFLVNAWYSVPDNSSFRFEPLLNGKETQTGVICGSNQLQKQLNKFLEKTIGCLRGKIGRYNLTIEVFLPSDLMCSEVDRWKILFDPIDDQATWGVKFPMRLRSLERLNPNYLAFYQQDWYRQWDKVKNILHEQPSLESFENIEKMEDFNCEILKKSLKEKIGLKLTCAPPQNKRRNLFKAILTSTTPIAIWARRDIPNFNQGAIIDQILHSQPLCYLSESVKKFREEANAQSDEHLGFHLALLWEDPYRLPPNAMIELKPAGE